MFLLAGEATLLYDHLTEVNNGIVQFIGNQLSHHTWHGLHFWDLIQPFFMFIVGVAMPFSFAKRWEKGQTWNQSLLHVIRRSLTLFFLGEVHEEKSDEIRECLRAIRKDDIGEIHFTTDEFGAFPNIKHPRVLVCKVNNPDGKVFTLNSRIAGILEDFGYSQDKKFSPHITLGRVKKNRELNLLNLKPKKLNKAFSTNVLFITKSILTFKGSEYEVLESISLINRE